MQKDSESFRSSSQTSVIPCIYHPENLIQNFCQNVECLLPMCAICIGMHALEHQSRKTYPNICSIGDAVNLVRKELLGFCSRLQVNSQHYTSDYAAKQKTQQECFQTLANIKAKVLREIQLEFCAMEAKIYQQIERFDSKIHQKYKQIEQSTSKLYSDLQAQLDSMTKNDLTLKTLITFNGEKLKVKIDQQIRKIQHAIIQLKTEEIQLIVKPNLFDFISNLEIQIFCQQLPQVKRDMAQTSPRSLFSEINFHYGAKSN